MGDVTTLTNQGTSGTDNPPADDQANANADQGQQTAGQGRSTRETRWEFGLFGRKVTTQDATPPDWDGGPPTP